MLKNDDAWVETIGGTGGAPQQHFGGKIATQNLIQQANIQDGDRILVLGCGSGQTVFFIAKRYNCEIIGTDINPKAIETSKKSLKKLFNSKNPLKSKVQFMVDDIFNSTLQKEEFDIILIESVLIMLPKESVLNILSKHLKPKGQICINEGLRISADEQNLKNVVEEFNKNGIDWSLPTYEEWKNQIITCKFDVVFDTGSISYSLIRIGIDSFLAHPFQSLKFVFHLVGNKPARIFYLRMQKLMKAAHIKWGYCLWVCKKSNI
jgi:SAM-dependent methyltransferase